jgi:hypothetical protein
MTEKLAEKTALCQTIGVAGWFEQVDSDVFLAIMSRQGDGDVLEIGAYLGDSAIPMGGLVRPKERFVVCDLWEDVFTDDDIDPKDRMHYTGLTLDRFLANWDAVHDWRPDVRKCDSLLLDLTNREFRFSHIDGCHMFEYVHHDIRIAASHAAPFGVIAIDDYRREHVPGVGAAVWHLEHDGVIFPFLTTANRLYAASDPQSARKWFRVMSQVAEEKNWDADSYAFPDYPVLMVRS